MAPARHQPREKESPSVDGRGLQTGGADQNRTDDLLNAIQGGDLQGPLPEPVAGKGAALSLAPHWHQSTTGRALATPTIDIRLGDCLDIMAAMEPESVDAIVSDPPYGIAFMGKAWDHGVPGVEFWRAALRVAKPGAHLLAFGGTRTYHRLGVAIEDAGWELRDCLAWMYGSGFPKSLDVSKAIDKVRDDKDQQYRVTKWIAEARDMAGIQNKDIDAAFGFNGMAGHWTSQSSQPLVPTLDQVPRLLDVLRVDRNAIPGDVADLLVELNGAKGQPGAAWFEREVIGMASNGAGNTGSESVPFMPPGSKEYAITATATPAACAWSGWGTALKPAWEPVWLARKPLCGTVAENVQRYGTGALNVDGCRVGSESTIRECNAGTGNRDNWRTGNEAGTHGSYTGRWPSNLLHDGSAEALSCFPEDAARFFYCAKASVSEREAGLDALPERTRNRVNPGGLENDPRWAPVTRRNSHPTVKPIALMRYLCRLVTPPGGLVFDPFTGSGSTGCGAVLEGFRFIGCDLSEEYVEVARARCAYWLAHPEGPEYAKDEPEEVKGQGRLWG